MSRASRFVAAMLASALAAGLLAVAPGAQAAIGRTIFSDNFEVEAPGGPPSKWQMLIIPPFNDNHSSRWAVENNTTGSPAHISDGGMRSLSWDDDPTVKPTDNFNDDGSRRDDFPLGVVTNTPALTSDRPGQVGTYTITSKIRMEETTLERLNQNDDKDALELTEDGRRVVFTHGAALGSLLWPPPPEDQQECPPGFGEPGDQCIAAGALAGGMLLADEWPSGTPTFDDDPSDDFIEVGALYISGFVNQTEVTRSGFADTLVPLRTGAIFPRDEFFSQDHTISVHVYQNQYLGLTIDGHFYGWGEVKNPDGSPVLVPLSKFNSIGMAGVIRNHTHFDNVLYQEGVPDTPIPDTLITSAPPAVDNSSEATFEFEAQPAASSYECRLDGGSFQVCESPKTYTGLADGNHSFAVRGKDPLGQADATPATHTWRVDTTAPETTISSGPSGVTNDTGATFAFTSSEPDSTFECSLDAAAFGACTSPTTLSDLAEGEHTFEVRALDGVGNVDPSPASRTWTVDSTPPDVTIDSAPDAVSTSATADFTFSASEPATFACKLDDGAFSACASPKSYGDLPQGAHSFTVRATDAAGNVSGDASHAWSIDLVPDTFITSAPPAATNSTDAEFTFEATEDAVFECSLDSAPFTACTSPQSYAALADGPHTFAVQATDLDLAPDTDPTPATHSWTIDATAPVTTIDSAPSDPSNSAEATFSFSADEADVTFHCVLDGGDESECASPATYGGLTDGEHTFGVHAVDAAGNVGSPVTHTWTVDAPPDTTLTATPAEATNDPTAVFEFTADRPSTFECSLDGGAFEACVSPHTIADLADGTYTFAVRAVKTSLDGPVDETPASFTWAVDTIAPETTIDSGPEDPAQSTTSEFTFSSNEDGGTFVCALDGIDLGACSSPLTLDVSEGEHTFSVYAIDAAGNVDPTPATYLWTVAASPPPAPRAAVASDLDRDGYVGVEETNNGQRLRIQASLDLLPGREADLVVSVTDGTTTLTSEEVHVVDTSVQNFDFDVRDLAEGRLDITVEASRAGQTATHALHTVLDLQAPQTTITTPDGATFYSIPFIGITNLRLNGTVTDNIEVRVVQLTLTSSSGERRTAIAKRTGPPTAQTWEVTGLALNPGEWTVRSQGLDQPLNKEQPGPTITILVL